MSQWGDGEKPEILVRNFGIFFVMGTVFRRKRVSLNTIHDTFIVMRLYSLFRGCGNWMRSGYSWHFCYSICLVDARSLFKVEWTPRGRSHAVLLVSVSHLANMNEARLLCEIKCHCVVLFTLWPWPLTFQSPNHHVTSSISQGHSLHQRRVLQTTNDRSRWIAPVFQSLWSDLKLYALERFNGNKNTISSLILTSDRILANRNILYIAYNLQSAIMNTFFTILAIFRQ